MGIMEAKFENAQRVLEADMHAAMEKQVCDWTKVVPGTLQLFLLMTFSSFSSTLMIQAGYMQVQVMEINPFLLLLVVDKFLEWFPQ